MAKFQSCGVAVSPTGAHHRVLLLGSQLAAPAGEGQQRDDGLEPRDSCCPFNNGSTGVFSTRESTQGYTLSSPQAHP